MMQPQPPQVIILTRLLAGDEEAFRELERQMFKPLCACIGNTYYSLTNDIEDLVQEAFVRLTLNLDKIKNDAHLRFWLLRVARNLAKDLLRKRGDPRDDDRVLAAVPDPSDGADVTYARQEAGDRVRKCLAELPACYREILILKYLDELKAPEIAQLLEIAPGTVASRDSKARRLLHKSLTRSGLFQGDLHVRSYNPTPARPQKGEQQ